MIGLPAGIAADALETMLVWASFLERVIAAGASTESEEDPSHHHSATIRTSSPNNKIRESVEINLKNKISSFFFTFLVKLPSLSPLAYQSPPPPPLSARRRNNNARAARAKKSTQK